MSNSHLPLSLPGSKSSISSVPSPSPAQSSGVGSLLAAERQRRSGSSTTSSSVPRNNASSPRNNQSLRKQNKISRRPKLNEDMAEAAALRTSSRKGQTNITHLMNFTLPPRPYTHSQHSHAGRGIQFNRKHNYSWGYNAVDKARYIHANYRFIVHPQRDYHYLTSVDDHLEWKDVLQVLVSSKSQSSSCPICLSDPISPRMAKCGHIFCLPCLIRYMHSTDDSAPVPERKVRWKRCPICEDSIYISEARPVRWFVGQESDPPREGGDVVLRLMNRDVNSTLALPKEGVNPAIYNQDIPWYFAAEVMDYARIMKGSSDYMQCQYDQEIADIELQEREDELMFGEETQWTQKAINSVREAKEKAKEIGNPPGGSSQRFNGKRPVYQDNTAEAFLKSNSPETKPNHVRHPLRSESFSSTEAQRIVVSETSTSPRSQAQNSAARNITQQKLHESPITTFFFYQALLHYYLAPLDIRILRAQFKDFSLFPSAVLARVDHISTGHIVDDDLRKRAKYLGHLPHGCEVAFLECDWTDIVSPDILDQFASDLDRRRKRNKDKELREEKERVRAEREEDDKRLASIRRRRDSLPREFPNPSSINIPGSSSMTNMPTIGLSLSPPWNPSRAGFGSLASPSTSPNGQRTVWGTTLVAPAESPTLAATRISLEPEHDGWLQGWEQDLMADDDFVAQVQAVSLADKAVPSPQPGKKKKQKKITLMSTNGRRAA